jgi:choline-glycine betaine transporter
MDIKGPAASLTPIPSPQSPVVQSGAPVEVQAIAGLFRGLIEPIAHAQETAETEKTKRAQIEANTASTFLRYSFGLAAALVAIAIMALFMGKDQLTEKISFAVIGFLGGFAFGKTSQATKE